MTTRPLDTAVANAQHILDTYAAEELLLRRRGAWPLVHKYLGGDYSPFVNPVPEMPLGTLSGILIAHVCHRLWQRSRVVYALDADMLAELSEHTDVEVVPSAAFRQLPHTNPLIMFPYAIPLTLPTGEDGRLLGFHVTGSTGQADEVNREFVATNDPRVKALTFSFLSDVIDSDGRVADFDRLRISVPVNVDQFGVEDQVMTIMGNFGIEPTAPEVDARILYTQLGNLIRLSTAVLAYVCSDKADVITGPPLSRSSRRPPAKGKGDGKKERPVRMLRVGWRVGPALRRARRMAARDRASYAASGRTQPPHQRRGHFKMQPYGPGRAERKLIYVQPYTVHRDLIEAMDNRVIPVK